MVDRLLSIWPMDKTRRVIKAEAQVVDAHPGLYRIAFMDSAGKQLAVQVPRSVLQTIVESASALFYQSR